MAEATLSVSVCKVFVEEKAMQKIKLMAEYEKEVGGWLTGSVANGNVTVTDVLIPEQDTGAAEVNQDAKSMISLLKEYGADVCKKIVGNIHTHNTMGAFWSADDEKFMAEVMVPRDLFVFIVTSFTQRNFTYLARLWVQKPVKFFVDGVELTELENEEVKKLKEQLAKVEMEVKDNFAKEIKEQIASKVKNTTTVATYYNGKSLQYWQDAPKITWDYKKMSITVAIDSGGSMKEENEFGDFLQSETLAEFKFAKPEVVYEKGKTIITLICADKKEVKKVGWLIRDYFAEKAKTAPKEDLWKSDFEREVQANYSGYGGKYYGCYD